MQAAKPEPSDEKVAHLVSLLGRDAATCRSALEAAAGDLDLAASLLLDAAGAGIVPQADAPQPAVVRRSPVAFDGAFERSVLLIGGSPAKRELLRKHLASLSCGLDYMPPVGDSQVTVDQILQMLRERNLLRVMTFVDQSTELVDELNARLEFPGNDPRTARSRRHKFQMHEALQSAGLRSCAHLETNDVEEAVAWAASREGEVVVKPPESAGCENVCVCDSEESVRCAFRALDRVNCEGSRNTTLLVEERLIGPEFVVNTVSLDGEHLVTDVWSSAPKRMSAEGCAYEEQRSVPADPKLVQYVFQVLDAVGLRNGPAHLELVGGDCPCLVEINPRAAGDLPRACECRAGYDQLYKTAEAIVEPDVFHSSKPYPLSPLPSTAATPWMHVCAVFLRSPLQGVADKFVLRQLLQLPTFHAVGRHLCYVDVESERPFKVKKTVDLHTCPGVLVFCSTDEQLIDEDVQCVRTAEAHGLYIDFVEPPVTGGYRSEAT